MATNETLPQETNALYKTVSRIIDDARNIVYRTANTAMVQAYWHIGRAIVEEEQSGKERAEYGNVLIKRLSQRLTLEYGKGFTETNLKYMRQFYRYFEKSHALRDELSWTHYRQLLRVENERARQFYMNEAAACNWSTRTLERQIGNLYFERMVMSKNDIAVRNEATEKQIAQQPQDIIKDPYVLDFLNLKDNTKFRESELEQAIIDKLQEFMLELGKGFAFVGRQYRLSTETGKHFYADLVFYNYILKCFLLIDLKSEPLTHQDIGQMDMYVRYFEDRIRQETDNPTIGLILCTEKDNTIVKYSLLNESSQIFASKYMLYLPSEQEFKREIERERLLIEQEQKLAQEL
ncbi:MAG: YhcG family protein [Mangrovibacterium sp.]